MKNNIEKIIHNTLRLYLNEELTSNQKFELPDWTKNYPCLSDRGTMVKSKKDDRVLFILQKNTQIFFKNNRFINFDESNKELGRGKWECKNGKLVITSDDGDQWTKDSGWFTPLQTELPADKWEEVSGDYLEKLKSAGKKLKQVGNRWYHDISDKISGTNTSTSDNTTIYKTHGDPYQYKVVDGEWFTKSLENRGKIIPDWISLETNIKATNILDGRFPNARK